MKPLLYILLPALCLSCAKQNNSISDQLPGKWELTRDVGGWTRTIYYPAGNGNIWEFTKINYSRYTNGTLSESGTYAIIKDSIWGQLADRIIYNGVDAYPKIFVTINNNELSFYTKMIDAGTGIYQRIK